jgi:hypothetical protein
MNIQKEGFRSKFFLQEIFGLLELNSFGAALLKGFYF